MIQVIVNNQYIPRTYLNFYQTNYNVPVMVFNILYMVCKCSTYAKHRSRTKC